MTRVKICGLKRVENALVAAGAGADYLGILFEPHSRHYLDADRAKELVQSFRAQWHHEKPLWVGVFANQPLEEVNHLLEYCGLDLAQLSGNESLEYCNQLVRPARKVFHVQSDAPVQEVVAEIERYMKVYQEKGHMLMLDTFKQGELGGTGQVFDWEVARKLGRNCSFLLAGGLSPENVAEAIRQVRPWGVDVSSGVETNGEKDATKIAQFIAQVRRTDGEVSANRRRA